MAHLRDLVEHILANGKVDKREIELLREAVYADDRVSRSEADLLVEMHKRVQRMSPGFQQFFYQAVKDHVLADGVVDAEETRWLRQMIAQDNKVGDLEKKFLNQVKGEARQVSPEFQALYEECLKS